MEVFHHTVVQMVDLDPTVTLSNQHHLLQCPFQSLCKPVLTVESHLIVRFQGPRPVLMEEFLHTAVPMEVVDQAVKYQHLQLALTAEYLRFAVLMVDKVLSA